MTREEAMVQLKTIRNDCYIISSNEDKQAFDMSIEALNDDTYTAYSKGWLDGANARENAKWITARIYRADSTYCSECGFTKHIAEHRNYNFCPNCGAYMKGDLE